MGGVYFAPNAVRAVDIVDIAVSVDIVDIVDIAVSVDIVDIVDIVVSVTRISNY